MELTNVFLYGFVLGETLTAVTLILWIYFLNKKRFGVYFIPKHIKEKYTEIIRKEIEEEKNV